MVRALPTASASKQRKPAPIVLTYSDLVYPEAADDSEVAPSGTGLSLK
jgi:hypothetical protein